MLHLAQYRKAYGALEVLKINEFKIDRGIYWLQGPNGSGKSTLLKTIAGILWFDGEITVDNIKIKDEPVAYRKLVNFCPAEPLFPGSLTGRDLIELFADAKDASKDQKEYLTTSMKVEPFLDQPLSSYSSGMKKKIALLLSFLGDARLILLDEPLITIDRDSLDIVYSWIHERFQQSNITFILSSHQSLDDKAIPGLQKLVIENATLAL